MKNYLSLWIANFGVVPLFSLAFFLFLPAFLALRFLRVLVLVVLDAIHISLKLCSDFFCKPCNLAILFLIVKNFVAYADTFEKTLFMSKGEQVKILESRLVNFSVGNKEVVSTTYKAGVLYLKGKAMGFSDLIVNARDGRKRYSIFVVSKRTQLKQARLAHVFERLGLEVDLLDDIIILKGSLKRKDSYLVFLEALKDFKDKIVNEVVLERKLRNLIIDDIYQKLYLAGAKSVLCKNHRHQFYCRQSGMPDNHPAFTELKTKYSIAPFPNSNLSSARNYKVSFRFFKITQSTQAIRDLGVESIEASIVDLLNTRSLIEGEIISLSDSLAKATVLAKPEFLMGLNSKSKFKLGGEFPVVTSNAIGQVTQWKYYGLQLTSLLQAVNERMQVEFNAKLDTPFESNIASASGFSKVFISLNEYQRLFQISFSQNKSHTQGIPLLKEIPFFRNFFSKDLDSDAYQKIVCFIKVEPAHDR